MSALFGPFHAPSPSVMRWSPGPGGDSAAVGGLGTHGSELGRSETKTIMSWIDTLEPGHDKIST